MATRKRKSTSAAALEPVSVASHLSIEVSEHTTRNAFWVLFGVNCALLVCDLMFNYGQVVEAPQIRRLFNIAREDSLANWVSSIQALFVFFCVAAIAYLSYRAHHAKNDVRAWTGFAAFFLFLATDDGAKIHERVGPVARDLATRTPSSDMPWYGTFIDWVGGYSWHAVVLPFFVLCGLALFAFCWKHFRNNHLRGFLFLACCLLAAAVGLDYFEGWFRNIPGESFGGWDRYTISHLQKACEEFMEMTANCLLFYVFSTHLLSLFHTVEVNAVAYVPATRGSKNRK